MRLLILSAFFIFIVSACSKQPSEPFISLTKDHAEIESEQSNGDAAVRVAFASVISPQATRSKYNLLVQYLEERLERPIEIIQKQTYDEVNMLLKSGEVDLAFICSLSYVIGTEEGYIVDVATPVVNGKDKYRSYIIVHQNSNINSIEDLKGKRVAYVDPYSNSGMLALIDMVRQRGYDETDFFEETFFTYSHDYSVSAVARGTVDAAAVDSLLFDQLIEIGNEDAEQVEVIEYGTFAGSPPIVVSHKTEQSLKNEIKEIILTLHEDPEGKVILKELKLDKYVPINQENYEPIRELLPLLDGGQP